MGLMSRVKFTGRDARDGLSGALTSPACAGRSRKAAETRIVVQVRSPRIMASPRGAAVRDAGPCRVSGWEGTDAVRSALSGCGRALPLDVRLHDNARSGP